MNKGEKLRFEVSMTITERQQTKQIFGANGQKETGVWRVGDESWNRLREGQSMVREFFLASSSILTRHPHELKHWSDQIK